MLHRLRFIPGRLVQSIPVAIGVTIIVFFMARLLPGNPALALLGQHATKASVAALSKQLGLDQPLWQQYLIFLGRLFQGNLGTSITYQMPVTQELAQAIPVTLSLLGLALLLSLVISIPLAALAAFRPGGARDLGVRGFTLLGQGMPQFWLGIMLILLLAVGVRAFPVGGYGETAGDHFYYLFLPALTLGITMCPTIIRSLRSSMINVLESEYVGTAKSKGSYGAALFRGHVLRNAAIPTVSVIGVNLGFLVGGSLVIEKVFALPGLGSMMINAIFTRDFPTIQGVTLFVAFFVVVVGILTDVVYTILDPRVDLSSKERA
ncbi:MAG: peptide/nickel transport system permease protein [Actinomycetota bacterium]|nr:transporter permease [Glaciihabitans sp.]MDQ1528243.1 peptide/nickel transport system permease protein [Actinomycetota bacterium]MDQ1561947.1 peptide/nickel transport system permease protein [Actinomycetota bacterium]MDQ1573887.1 peptide/nickel transport system permease protein [Actinomycetota bacterium]